MKKNTNNVKNIPKLMDNLNMLLDETNKYSILMKIKSEEILYKALISTRFKRELNTLRHAFELAKIKIENPHLD